MDFTSATFWAALGSIILANVLLSGDNAVVIALAARSLPPRQQGIAILLGSTAAIVMRVVLTLLAVELLKWPFLRVTGALLLLYIGVALMVDKGKGHGEVGAGQGGIPHAVRTILIADLVMSLDNVLAVAAAAKGNTVLLVLGLAISVPLITFGSTLLLKLVTRLPVIITAGAGLLGYLAGEMLLADPAVTQRFGVQPDSISHLAGAIGASSVVAAGKLLLRRRRDLAAFGA